MPDAIDFARRMRIFVYEGDPFWGSAGEIVDLMNKCHANAIRYTGGIRHGVTCYPSRYFPPHPQLGGRDLLGEMVEACEKHNFHVFPHIQFLYAFRPEATALHPDWAARNPDGTPIKTYYGTGSGPTDGTAICYKNPAVAEAFAKACQEIITKYPVSGMYFDIAWRGNCFCAYCKKVFFEQYGYELPVHPFANKKHKHDYIHGIRIRGKECALKTVVTAIKSVRNLPIIFNMVEANKRYSRHGLMNFTDGALVAEINNSDYMDILQRIKTGVAFRRAAWCYCPVANRDLLTTEEVVDTKLSALTEISHGGTPIVETIRAYLHDKTGVAQLNQIYSFMHKNENLFYDYQPVPWIALHCSAQTALEYGIYDTRSDGTEKGIWDNIYFSGAFSAMTQAHHPFTVILDQDINSEKLHEYQVIFLPNVACLSQEQINIIKEFVHNGGGLIATYETSLYDETGERRSDFGLKDLFKANYLDSDNNAFISSHFMEGPYLRICLEHPITSGFEIDKKIPYYRGNHPFLRVSVAEDISLVGDIFYAEQEAHGAPLTYPGGQPPAIIAADYGQGRVIYMPAALDYLYAKTSFRLIRQLFDNCIRFLTHDRLLIATDVPNSVVINFTEDNTTRLLHILNYSGNTLNHEKVQLENIIPLNDLHFSIAPMTGKKLAKVTQLSGARELEFTPKQGYDNINLNKISEYECLVLVYV